MKALLALFVLLLAIPSSAQTHIRFDLNAPFFNAFPASNRVVTLRALSPFPGNTISYTSDSSGVFYHSNAAATDYAGLITRRGQAGEIPFQVTVSHTNLGVVNADAITSVLGQQSYPVSGRSSWSIQAADQRFLLTPTNAATANDGQVVSKTGDKTAYIDPAAGSVTYNLGNSTNLPASSINSGTAGIDVTGNAASATLASYVSGTLSNSISGNADTATTAANLSGGITQSQVTGLPAALSAKLDTNQNPVLNPLMFGAVADGTTDDTLAWSNAIVALNAGSGLVLDGLGKRYRFTAPMPVITAQSATIQNGVILYDSQNGVVFSKTNRNHTGVFPAVSYAAQFTIQNMGIYQVAGVPSPGNVAICLGDGVVTNSAQYGVNYVARNNVITNFWQGVVVSGAVQANIEYNAIYQYWSNAVFVMGGVDMLRIGYNNLDNRTGLAFVPQMHTNSIIIQIEPWQALVVDVVGNNMGGAKQAYKGTGVGRLTWRANQAEGFFTLEPNLTKFESWGSAVFMEGDGWPGGFGSSNYLATVGLYAFGTQRIHLDKSAFRGVDRNFSIDVFSTNAFDADFQFPIVVGEEPIVRRHVAWGDAGAAYTFGESGTQMESWTSITNRDFRNPIGDIVFRTGGTEWGRINRSGGGLTASQSTLFNGQMDAGIPRFQGISDRGGSPTTFDIAATNKNQWRLLSLNNSTVDLSGSNNVLRIHANLNRGNAISAIGVTAAGEVTTNGIPSGEGGGDLLAANNLSELSATASTARANLGLTIGTDVLAPNGNGSALTALNASELGSGIIPDARMPDLTGDVTTSEGAVATTIANGAVSLAKMANLAQDQFIGRTTASTGVPQTATITAAARTVLDDATVDDMVNTLGGASSSGSGGLARLTSPVFVGPIVTGSNYLTGTSYFGGGNVPRFTNGWVSMDSVEITQGDVILIDPGSEFIGTHRGNGQFLTNLDASTLASGLVPPQRLAPTNDIPTDKTYSLHYQNGTNVWSEDTGGAGTITGTDTHVLFFDGANTPAGDAGFTYNKTTDSATLANVFTVKKILAGVTPASHPEAASIAGGTGNQITGSNQWSFIGGGYSNTVAAGTGGAFVADNGRNFIGAGQQNYIGFFSTNSGTVGNSFIGAGIGNRIFDNGQDASAITAGSDNTIGAAGLSFIGGGYQNTILGDPTNAANYSVIPGGRENFIGGSDSFAAGAKAGATNDHSFVWSDGIAFGTTGTNQFLVRASGGVGINTNDPGTHALSVHGDTFLNGAATVTGAFSAGSVNVDVVNTPQFNVGNIGVTNNLVVTNNLIVGGTITGNGGGLTNLDLTIRTNGINTGVIPVGRVTYTNITANITIAGFSGVDSTGSDWAEMYVTNGSGPGTPRSVTFAASVGTSTNTFVLDRTFWVTNDIDIMVKVRPWRTNAAAVRWSP